MRRMVSVVGGDPCTAEESVFARQLGRELASREIVVVTGGLGGVMAAASQGAKEAGGLTIGLLPGRDQAAANSYVDIAIPTGMGELRNGLVVSAGEMICAVGGEYGTLSEIAFALKAGKPVIGWHTWEFSRRTSVAGAIIAVTSIDHACKEIERCLHLGSSE